MRLRLVHPAGGNAFMRDILDAIAFEARELGVDAEVVIDRFPEGDDLAYLTIPHEYFSVTPGELWPSREQLRRTIAFTVEHADTHNFELSTQQARRCAAIVDINTDSVSELLRRGLRASHLQIGYTRAWDQWNGEDRDRATDITYLGSLDQARVQALGDAAPFWWDKQTFLALGTGYPHTPESDAYLLGSRKFAKLADTKVLLNLHRGQSRALEWVRVIEAMCNGAVVVSEHSVDPYPLVPGTHFHSIRGGHAGAVCRALLDQPDRLAQVRSAAYDFIRSRIPLRAGVERLLRVADSLVRRPGQVPDPDVPSPQRYQPPPPAWPTQVTRDDLFAAGVRRLEARLMNLERALQRDRVDSLEPSLRQTPAFDQVSPKVSVIIPLHNHPDEVVEALDSVQACTGVDFDVTVQDDASTDHSRQVVVDYLAANPHFPLRLVEAPVNQGLSRTRNDLWRRARGEYVFALDADNGVYPTALQRLSEALDAKPEAAFAYSIIRAVKNGQTSRLVSQYPWWPWLLRYGNYIDAMTMLRRSTLERFNGWSTSMPFGWEDYHLWCRIGDADLPAAFVPQMLSWYRDTEHSMLMSTNLDLVTMWSRIRSDAPTLMGDQDPLGVR